MNNTILIGLRKVRDIALEYAQSSHEFKNRTFNLEDSYGAAIYYDGRIIEKTLSNKKATQTVKKGGVQYSGRESAERFLNEFSAGDGYTLVVVAGMFYATWVETIHGLDVLTGSYQTAREKMKTIWKELPKTYYTNE